MAEARRLLLAPRQLPSQFVLALLVLILAFPSHTFTANNTLSFQANVAAPIVIPASQDLYRACRSMSILAFANKA